MMMFPARTCSPPKRFTPRRLDSESRPFLVLPPAFLCAMTAVLYENRPEKMLTSAGADVGDLHLGEELAMRLLSQIVRTALELDDRDLGAFAMAYDSADDLAAFEERGAELHVSAFADEQDFAELDGRAGFAFQLLDAQHVVFGDTILFTAGGDDCVHK